MFKKTITFTTFAGATVIRDFWFHLSKADIISMGVADMENRLKTIVGSNDGPAILKAFTEIIEMSVGVRSEDGERFIKDAEAKSKFMDSPAFDELLMELATNEQATTDFITNLLPANVMKEIRDQMVKNEKAAPASTEDDEDTRPAWEREKRIPTTKELREMPKEELVRAFQLHPTSIPGLLPERDS